MSKIEFDSKTKNEMSGVIGKNLSGSLYVPLAKVLEESKDGIQPLIGFYTAAKKGKTGIIEQIARDVANRIFYKFAESYMMGSGLSNLSMDVDKQKDGVTFSPSYAPYEQNISNIFKINETNPPVVHEEEMKFHLYLYGGFKDLKITSLNKMKILNFGGLSGTLVVTIRKFPFMTEDAFFETPVFEKNISVGLSQFSALIR